MSVSLELQNELLSLLLAQPGGASPQTSTAEGTKESPPEPTSPGEKHFNRLHRTSSTDAPATASASPDAPTNESTGESVQQQIFDLMTQVALSLGTSVSDAAQMISMAGEQAQASSEAADVSYTQTIDNLAQQAKREKHMKWLGIGMKVVGATILVLAVATGQPELAPLSTMLMLGVGITFLAAPQLVSNSIITPLAGFLTSLGVPEKYATILSTVIVMGALVALTAGAGAADAGFAGKAVTQQIGREAAVEALQDGTMKYGKLAAGNAMINASVIMGSSQLPTQILMAAFPNHPIIAEIVGTSLTLLLSISTAVGGGYMVSSSGYFNGASIEKSAQTAKYASQGLRGVEAVAQGGGAWMSFEQGITAEHLANAQAALQVATSCTQTSGALSQSAQAMMQLIAKSMSIVSSAIQSMALPGEAALRYAG